VDCPKEETVLEPLRLENSERLSRQYVLVLPLLSGSSLTFQGALGLGLQTSSALTTVFTFLAYLIPIYGGIVADTKWGRFKT
jgi:hypothetical protein